MSDFLHDAFIVVGNLSLLVGIISAIEGAYFGTVLLFQRSLALGCVALTVLCFLLVAVCYSVADLID